jgi:hypothetical protein
VILRRANSRSNSRSTYERGYRTRVPNATAELNSSSAERHVRARGATARDAGSGAVHDGDRLVVLCTSLTRRYGRLGVPFWRGERVAARAHRGQSERGLMIGLRKTVA